MATIKAAPRTITAVFELPPPLPPLLPVLLSLVVLDS
jgi:hypothetical protein